MSTNDDSAWATPLTNNNKLVIKIFTFGMAALVGSSILGFAIYYVFFRKGHRERKAARKEEVARNLEKGILPKSKHYGIGKVPKKKCSPPPTTQKRYFRAQSMSNPTPSNCTPSPERSSDPLKYTPSPRRSSLHNPQTPRDPTRTPRVSWGSDVTIDVLPPPKAMITQKITANTTSH